MKTLPKLLCTTCLLVSLSTIATAQKDVITLLSGNLSDANALAKAYLEPFGKSFATSLNNGWYNTAKPHKLLGFDITVNTAITIPPASDKTFNVNNLNLNYWSVQSGQNPEAPTVTGEEKNGPTLVNGTAQLPLPTGANLKIVPAPAIQLGVGLPLHTELVGRFFPKVNIGDYGQFSLWGVGIKNEFKEFIPGFKLLPVNISLLVGYTSFESTIAIDDSKKQDIVFNATALTGKLLISKSIPVLTVYAGIGYNKSKTDVKLKGSYDIPNVGTAIIDPVAFEIDNKGMNANLGLRIKLALIAFHFDYSFGKYAVYNAGVGINFR